MGGTWARPQTEPGDVSPLENEIGHFASTSKTDRGRGKNGLLQQQGLSRKWTRVAGANTCNTTVELGHPSAVRLPSAGRPLVLPDRTKGVEHNQTPTKPQCLVMLYAQVMQQHQLQVLFQKQGSDVCVRQACVISRV